MKFFLLSSILLLSIVNVSCSSGTSGASDTKPAYISSAAGGVDGGGGIGVMCGSSLQTLDLFEARKSGLNPTEKFGTLEENIKFFGMEMAKYLSESLKGMDDPKLPDLVLKEMQDSIIGRFKDIASGERLTPTRDATLPNLPSNCQVVQIAVYSKEGTIYRDAEYWSKLSIVEKTALIVHEWIYHRARTYGAVNSDESRKVIGMLFSGNNPEPLLSPIWNSNQKIWCGAGIEGSDQEIYEIFGIDEIRNGTTGVAFYFRAFKSVYLSSRTSTFLPNISLSQFMNNEFNSTALKVKNELMSKEWDFEIVPDNFLGSYKLRAFGKDQPKPPLSSGFCKWE